MIARVLFVIMCSETRSLQCMYTLKLNTGYDVLVVLRSLRKKIVIWFVGLFTFILFTLDDLILIFIFL